MAEVACSLYSKAAGEDLIATVSPATIWFLLDYDARWERKALEAGDLDPAVRDYLLTTADALGARTLAIRQKPRLALEGSVALFVVIAREQDPVIYQFPLARYEDLLALDLTAGASESAAFDAYRRADPLYLVCTHGRRDPCCARSGLPLYTQLVASAGERVWQSSHMGGHRFAANMLCFPHGLCYGRVGLEDGDAIRGAYERGEIVLDRYRGRACYPKPAQAAEFLLRTATGVGGLDAYRLEAVEPEGAERWAVRFARREGGEAHLLHVREEVGALQVLESCASEAPSPVSRWHLDRHETTSRL